METLAGIGLGYTNKIASSWISKCDSGQIEDEAVARGERVKEADSVNNSPTAEELDRGGGIASGPVKEVARQWW